MNLPNAILRRKWDGICTAVSGEGILWLAGKWTAKNSQCLKFIRYQWETKHWQVFMQITGKWIHLRNGENSGLRIMWSMWKKVIVHLWSYEHVVSLTVCCGRGSQWELKFIESYLPLFYSENLYFSQPRQSTFEQAAVFSLQPHTNTYFCLFFRCYMQRWSYIVFVGTTCSISVCLSYNKSLREEK